MSLVARLPLTRAALALALCGAAACGTRTGLLVPDADVDLAGFDMPPPCTGDGSCDDHVACTVDRCTPTGCTHTTNDHACDDGMWCDGVETCALSGCLPGAPACDDGIACTDDTCDEGSHACRFTPDAHHCPLSNLCDPMRGCEPAVYAVDDARLYAIELPGGTLFPIVPTESVLTDLALAADGTFYGASSRGLVTLDDRTGVVSLVFPVRGHFVALEADPPTGVIYGGTSDSLMRFDVAAGMATTVATLPPGIAASGDIAFVGARLLMTTTSDGGAGAPDDLYAFDLTASGPPTRLGSVGVPCMWALATYHGALYGLTCSGDVREVDPTTGASTLIVNDGVRFGGAAAR